MPYIGGISSVGILNVNQGMLPTAVLKALNGFSEEFRMYGIDPDLTARVLYSGYDVVYTRSIALHHNRNWSDDPESQEYKELALKQKSYLALYDEKYRVRGRLAPLWALRRFIWRVTREVTMPNPVMLQHAFLWVSLHAKWLLEAFPGLRRFAPPWHAQAQVPTRRRFSHEKKYFGLLIRDWNNLWTARYTNPLEAFLNRNQLYHLRQHCPRALRPKGASDKMPESTRGQPGK